MKRRCFLNDRGFSYVGTAAFILFAAAVLAFVMCFASVLAKLREVKENAGRVLDGYVMTNAIAIYNSIKQGHDRTGALSGVPFAQRFAEETGTAVNGETVTSNGEDGALSWQLISPSVGFDQDNSLRLKVSFIVRIPVHIGDFEAFNINVPMTVRSRYVSIEQ